MHSTRRRIAIAGLGLALALPTGCDGRPEGGRQPTAAADSPPAPVPAGASAEAADGVTVAGRVVGGSAGDAVPGAYVVVLQPGVPFERWEAAAGPETETLIHTAVRADSTGSYRLPGIPRGHDYTVMIAARGYRSAAFDLGLAVEADAPAVVTMDTVALEPAVW